MPHRTVRIRKRTVATRPPQKKLCHCVGKKKCKYPIARRDRKKVNYAHLRKWNSRAHTWVTRGRGLLNPTQKANWDLFRAGFREGFHKILDPVTQFATPPNCSRSQRNQCTCSEISLTNNCILIKF